MPPSRLEEPPKFVHLRWTDRSAELLPKRVLIRLRGIRQVMRNQSSDGPCRQRSEQFCVALEEHPKVDRQRPRDQIDEYVRAVVVTQADRKLVGEAPLGLTRRR